MFCFKEFAFTVLVKHKINSTNSWLYIDMFVFYDWPFPHVYFAKIVAYFSFNSWLSFQRLCTAGPGVTRVISTRRQKHLLLLSPTT